MEPTKLRLFLEKYHNFISDPSQPHQNVSISCYLRYNCFDLCSACARTARSSSHPSPNHYPSYHHSSHHYSSCWCCTPHTAHCLSSWLLRRSAFMLSLPCWKYLSCRSNMHSVSHWILCSRPWICKLLCMRQRFKVITCW